MTFDQILQDLKKGNFQPLYIFHGEEGYFIDTLTRYIEQRALPEEQRAFNQTVLYGRDTDAKTLLDVAQRYPMMAERQVVILKEAQEMKGLSDLKAYVEQPVETTILVIAHKNKKIPGNTTFGKAIKKKAVVLEARPLYDNQIPGWIKTYLKARHYTITEEATALVAEYLGSDLSKVANELDKLIINLPKGTEITPAQIEAQVGISKDYNVFELQKALGQRNPLKAQRIVQYFSANPKRNPFIVVVSSLFNYFSKILMLHELNRLPDKELAGKLGVNPYFLREYRAAARQYSRDQLERIIHLLSEYDLKSKGVGYDTAGKPNGALLKELVWRIMN